MTPFVEFMKYYFSSIKKQNRTNLLRNIVQLNDPFVALVDNISGKYSEIFKKMFPIFKSIFLEVFIANYQNISSETNDFKTKQISNSAEAGII